MAKDKSHCPCSSFSNHHLRLDLPLNQEESLLLHSWPRYSKGSLSSFCPGDGKKALCTAECLGTESGCHLCNSDFCSRNSGSRSRETSNNFREDNSLLSFGEEGVIFLPQSLQWLSCFNLKARTTVSWSSDDSPALSALIPIPYSKQNRCTVHTAVPKYPITGLCHSRGLPCLLAWLPVAQPLPSKIVSTLQSQ